MRSRGSLIAVVLLLAASCAPSPAVAPSPTPAVAARALDGRPMRECFVGSASARCGSLLVAVDPAHPDGRRIDLRVAVVPATDPSARDHALFLVTGGPGGASTTSFDWAAGAFEALRATHDLVLVDQRGTGGSDRLTVPPRPDVGALGDADAAEAIGAWLEPAFAALPADVRFYTTRVAADDLDAVRAGLGYEVIDLYGVSYGATLVQYYLRQHPTHVRSVVLDGATLLDVPVMELVARNAQRALDLLFDRCGADTSCRAAYPALRSEFAAVMTRLAEHPVRTSIRDAAGRSLVVDARTFAAGVHNALLAERTAAALPYLIHLAYLERWDDIAGSGIATPPQDDTADLVMSLVIRCAEPWARFDPVEIARNAPDSFDRDTQVAWAKAQALACEHVPPGVTATGDGEAVVSDAPTLLLVGGADPQDPPDNVARAPLQLRRSRTVVAPDQGHTVAHLGCVGSIVSAFVRSATVSGLDTTCLATGVPRTPFRLP